MKPWSFCNSGPKQRGFSLVEMMVAMTVGLILTAGVIQIFINSKQSYRIQEALSRLQENGRFAIAFITRDIRNAGYFGCGGMKTSITNTLNNPNQFAWNFSIPLQGNEATGATTWTPTPDNSITNPLGGTDIITIYHASGAPIRVAKHPGGSPPGSADIQLKRADADGLDECDIVMVSDCTDSAIFQITNINTTGKAAKLNVVHSDNSGGKCGPGNNTKALGKSYGNGGSVVRLATTTYYIRNNSQGIPYLYQIQGSSQPRQLIQGVEDMQILYGVDTDNSLTVNRYFTANNVANWGNVINVRVSLLLRTSQNNLTPSPQTYTYNGNSITATDGRLRRIFTTTVNLRNRTL